MLNILTKTVIQNSASKQQNMNHCIDDTFDTNTESIKAMGGSDDQDDGEIVVDNEDGEIVVDNEDEEIVVDDNTVVSNNNDAVQNDSNDSNDITSSGNSYNPLIVNDMDLPNTVDYSILHEQITEILKNETLQSVGLIIICDALGFHRDAKLLTPRDKNTIIYIAGVISNYIQTVFDNGKHRISVTGGGLPFICHLVGWLQIKITPDVEQNTHRIFVSYNELYAQILLKIINSVTFFGSKTFEEIEHLLKDRTVFTRLSLRKAGAITISTKRNNKVIHMRYSHFKETIMQLTSYSEEVTKAVALNKSQTKVELNEILDSFDKIIGDATERCLYCR